MGTALQTTPHPSGVHLSGKGSYGYNHQDDQDDRSLKNELKLPRQRTHPGVQRVVAVGEEVVVAG
ncbi:MAG: hypothetical protein Q4D38_06740, partial [Planctomycetia bacterium]|nr:hypothetical protein [Planctomycetia bacterium]